MAILTALEPGELAQIASEFGVAAASSRGILAGSVNTNYEIVARDGRRWFLRVYEEQDDEGARRDATLLSALAEAGVRTPRPLRLSSGAGYVTRAAGKPICLFPFIIGTHRCQASVTPADAHAVGAALAAVHRVGAELETRGEQLTGQSRFSLAAIEARLRTLPDRVPDHVERARDALLNAVEALRAWRPVAPDLPLVHGDLFRDNVLFDERGPTLLDFESASKGGAAFDLVVTVLAWCVGDGLDAELAAAMVSGYATQRTLTEVEIEDVRQSARLACVRFATTRITDYELRPPGSGVYKDYRRWLARLDVVEELLGLREGPVDITLRNVWQT